MTGLKKASTGIQERQCGTRERVPFHFGFFHKLRKGGVCDTGEAVPFMRRSCCIPPLPLFLGKVFMRKNLSLDFGLDSRQKGKPGF